jgi:alcohol dehydrogenase class IV
MLTTSLPTAVKEPTSVSARSSVLYGAFLAGLSVASGGLALQHKLAHVIAGSFGLPHAPTHAILLPHTVAYNLPALAPHVVSQLESALAVGKGETIVTRLDRLLHSLEINSTLRDLGMSEQDVDTATWFALEKPYWNPREWDRAKIRELIRRAWAGERARADL